ncbi:MAG: GlsB/YeaQ/YmgE family stress response membrane protein [Vicinamibacterales bacterium]
MGVLGWIVFGLVVGVIAKLVMPGRDPGGLVVTVLLGIAGAMVGGFLGRLAGFYGPGDAAGLVMSTLGAIALLFVYRKVRSA